MRKMRKMKTKRCTATRVRVANCSFFNALSSASVICLSASPASPASPASHYRLVLSRHLPALAQQPVAYAGPRIKSPCVAENGQTACLPCLVSQSSTCQLSRPPTQRRNRTTTRRPQPQNCHVDFPWRKSINMHSIHGNHGQVGSMLHYPYF